MTFHVLTREVQKTHSYGVEFLLQFLQSNERCPMKIVCQKNALFRGKFSFSFLFSQAFTFVGLVGMSYLAAFIVSVCVEYPMMQLEKLIFKTNR